MEFEPIGVVHSPYHEKKEVPVHKYNKNKVGKLEIYKKFEGGLKDIEGFSHLFVIFVFNKSDKEELLGHPPFDSRSHGVFSTKSPNRPNHIGLTVVELKEKKGNILYIKGIDMLDKTPVLDIKPFLGYLPNKVKKGWLEDLK